jgi:hypothetical protein
VTWGFIWIMVALKIPLAALIFIVWWAIKQEPEDSTSSDDDGGVRRPNDRIHPHPHKPFPRHPRRGPHGESAPPSPARVRTVKARARTLGH